jgi:hypothetical protein
MDRNLLTGFERTTEESLGRFDGVSETSVGAFQSFPLVGCELVGSALRPIGCRRHRASLRSDRGAACEKGAFS